MTNKLKVDRELLVSKLAKAYKFVPTKVIIPAWDNFKMTVTNSTMEIVASDGNIQIKMYCPVTSSSNFSFYVPAGLLLKTVPDDYFYKDGKQIVSDSAIYKMLGNGWTIKVISHILKFSK